MSFSYLRPMDESDLDWVCATELLAYDFPWTRNGFVKALDDGLTYVFCDVNHQPLGYACSLAVVDEVHLLNFCVDPAMQGQGIGRAALEELCVHFKAANFSVMLLEVRVSNHAIQLYEKVGFKTDGVRPNYYPLKSQSNNLKQASQKEDAMLMSRML